MDEMSDKIGKMYRKQEYMCYTIYAGAVCSWYIVEGVYTMANEKSIRNGSNGLKVNLFEYDIESEESISQIKEYLINKVKISKVHNTAEYDLTYYGTQNLESGVCCRFNEQVARTFLKIIIPQFDVRRRVTEWMAQYLLEQTWLQVL